MSRPNLLGLSRAQLAEALSGLIDRDFRVDQVYRSVNCRLVEDFDAITDLSLGLRRSLAERFTLARPRVKEKVASRDGTAKYLLSAGDTTVEAVYIPEEARRTICVSSQAGCALACRFCVTGYWGAGRDLTPAEIVGQVLAISADQGLDLDDLHLVFMGMGEPLLNLDNVRAALEALSESLSWRRMTVSTAGVLPGIERMASWPRRPNLAISLHAADDERRNELMPINRKYPLADLLAVLRRYPTPRGRPLTFEYTLIRDFNDRKDDPARLARLLDGLRYKVNLIPLNPDPVLAPLAPPSMAVVRDFERELRRQGVACSVRRPRGDDVGAACGQLRAVDRRPRGFTPLSISAGD